ncbi:hypothetical protein [Ureaplasma ceti]|uniref:Lipoprotein n=1 Tax=Ureaplasma ceti TaxID=3119530 RepID=A0ABP9U8E1_9BACT
MHKLTKNFKIGFALAGVALMTTAVVVPTVVCTTQTTQTVKVHQDSNTLQTMKAAEFFSFEGFFNHAKSEWNHLTNDVHHDMNNVEQMFKSHFKHIEHEVDVKSTSLKASFNNIEHEFKEVLNHDAHSFAQTKEQIIANVNKMESDVNALLKNAKVITSSLTSHAKAEAEFAAQHLKNAINSILTDLGLNSKAGLEHDGQLILEGLEAFFQDFKKSIVHATFNPKTQVLNLPWQMEYKGQDVTIPLTLFLPNNNVLTQQQKNQYLLDDVANVINKLGILSVANTKLSNLGTVLTLISEFSHDSTVANNSFVKDMNKVLEYYNYIFGPKSPLNYPVVKTIINTLLTAYPEAYAIVNFAEALINDVNKGIQVYNTAETIFNSVINGINSVVSVNGTQGEINVPIVIGQGANAAKATIKIEGFKTVSYKEANTQLANFMTNMFNDLHLNVQGTKLANLPQTVQDKEVWLENFSNHLNEQLVKYEHTNKFEAWIADKEFKPFVNEVTKLISHSITDFNNTMNFNAQKGEISIPLQIGTGANVAYAHLNIFGFNK